MEDLGVTPHNGWREGVVFWDADGELKSSTIVRCFCGALQNIMGSQF